VAEEENQASSALRAIFAELAGADEQFRRATTGEQQREAMVRGLFVVSALANAAGLNQFWHLFLIDALKLLDQEVVLPMLKKKLVKKEEKAKGGRGPAGVARHMLHGIALAVAQELTERRIPSASAYRRVANVLHRAGARPLRGGGRITAQTIMRWEKSVSEDPNSITAQARKRFLPLDQYTASDLLRFLADFARPYAISE
jgi:hypothetical protein